VQDSRLINIDHHHNHEKITIKLITCKQQNIRKTENTTNEEQQHLQCLMMTFALALSASPKPYSSSSIRLLLHPNFHLDLVHIEKEQTQFQVTVTSTIIPSPS
jgi:hypothetical protein